MLTWRTTRSTPGSTSASSTCISCCKSSVLALKFTLLEVAISTFTHQSWPCRSPQRRVGSELTNLFTVIFQCPVSGDGPTGLGASSPQRTRRNCRCYSICFFSEICTRATTASTIRMSFPLSTSGYFFYHGVLSQHAFSRFSRGKIAFIRAVCFAPLSSKTAARMP